VDNPDPLTQKFVQAYVAKYGAKPDSLAALGYDAAGVLLDAMKRVGAPANGDFSDADYKTKLRDAIGQTSGYKGATGTITLGPDHNPIKPCVVLQIHGSDFKYVTTIQP
jgi:branched-chain amino acid transport system substrate-binding protein